MVVAERTWSSSGGAGTGFGSEGKKDTCCQPTPRRGPSHLALFQPGTPTSLLLLQS